MENPCFWCKNPKKYNSDQCVCPRSTEYRYYKASLITKENPYGCEPGEYIDDRKYDLVEGWIER